MENQILIYFIKDDGKQEEIFGFVINSQNLSVAARLNRSFTAESKPLSTGKSAI